MNNATCFKYDRIGHYTLECWVEKRQKYKFCEGDDHRMFTCEKVKNFYTNQDNNQSSQSDKFK